MPYLLLLVFFLTRVFASVTTKMNSRSFSAFGNTGSLLFVMETSIFSLLFFWGMNGFKLFINPTVALYSAVYGALVVLNLFCTVFVYNYGSVATVSFVIGTVSLIASMISGMLLFGERMMPDKLLRIGLMFVCIFIVLLGAKKNAPVTEREAKGHSGIHPLAIILPTAMAVISTCVSLIIKYYSTDVTATDSNTLFFMTNLFSLIYSIPIVFVTMKRDKISPKDVIVICKDKRSAVVFLNTAIGCVQAGVTALLLATMDVAVYTPLTSALGFIALAAATPMVRERLDRYTVCATAVAILSIVLPTVLF